MHGVGGLSLCTLSHNWLPQREYADASHDWLPASQTWIVRRQISTCTSVSMECGSSSSANRSEPSISASIPAPLVTDAAIVIARSPTTHLPE
eukprot:2805018-Pyramimonas_sp.AAC.1